MASCANTDFLNQVKADVYVCNTKTYPADEKKTKLINIILEREGGYNLFDESDVSGETYRGIDRKNGVKDANFWGAVDAKVDECFAQNKNIVTYSGTHVTEEYKRKHGNRKVKDGTYFDNDGEIKQMAINIYANNFYLPNGIDKIVNPMIAGHTLSQAAHYGAGGTAWLDPLVKAINAVCGVNLSSTGKITQEMLNYVNGDKACDIANKYTEFRRERYAKSKQTQYIKGWLNMVNGWVKAVNRDFK